MFCPKCGNEIKENQKFCAKCGWQINEGHSNIPNQNKTECSKKSFASTITSKFLNNKKLLIISIVAIVLVIGIIIAIVVGSNNKDSKYDGNNYNSVGNSDSTKNTDDVSDETQNVEKKDTAAFISSVSDISGGVAKATLETEDGTSYEAIIDLEGNIRYICSAQESFVYAPSSENDIGCISTENSSTYKLINAKGEVIKTCDGSEFDELVALGNGYALVYKYEATIDSETHLYGVINNKGEWAVELTNYGQEPFRGYENHYSSEYDIWADYIGSNIFDIRVGYSGGEHMMLNATTGKAFWVYLGWSGHKDYNKDISFEDGVHYVICNYSGTYYHAFVSDIPLRTNGEVNGDTLEEQKDLYRTSHDFALYPDGTWKNIMKYPEHGYESITSDYPAMNDYEKTGDKWTKVENDYITIYDYETKTSAQFTDYKSSMVSGINFEGSYSIARIEGVDQKSYFTIIDSKGVMQFEPITYSGSYPSYGSEKVVYKNSTGKYVIMDPSGNVISENLDFDDINVFKGDVAEASKNGRICFINSKGEVLLDEIKMPQNIG